MRDRCPLTVISPWVLAEIIPYAARQRHRAIPPPDLGVGRARGARCRGALCVRVGRVLGGVVECLGFAGARGAHGGVGVSQPRTQQ